MRRFENAFTAWLLVLTFVWTSIFSASGVSEPLSKTASGDFFANTNESVWENEPPALMPCRGNRFGFTMIASGVLIMSFYSYDGLGSVRGLTDAVGTSLGNYHYDAYGVLIENTVSVANPYLFAGERYDNDLGLYYLRARYLDVETGRFWSLDDFEGRKTESITLHKYLYGNGNPVSNVDPSGNFSIVQVTAAIAIGTSLVFGARLGVGLVNQRWLGKEKDIYLNFDELQGMRLHKTDSSTRPFSRPTLTLSELRQLKDKVISVVSSNYASYGVSVSDKKPSHSKYKEIYFSGINDGFNFGYMFLGSDKGIVYVGSMITTAGVGGLEPEEWGQWMGNVASHELGHAYGLDHNGGTNNIMNSGVEIGEGYGEPYETNPTWSKKDLDRLKKHLGP